VALLVRSARLLAELCYDLAGGDPELALWLAVRATQLEAERRRAERQGPPRVAPPLKEALRLLGEGWTREMIALELGWPELPR
jgi:hypothetical protein